ncbi:hypothetical protein SLI_3935 [Streptomyces lividans 1326]|uniref:Uncharacterized protein n=1 Tax=Streptomyces lividans 1326 TaxID=1200984 RepID=A0A7U9HCA9_STRLI|nr:hypothetical protein SLI_3935 [Streptomyces lividans 1326]
MPGGFPFAVPWETGECDVRPRSPAGDQAPARRRAPGRSTTGKRGGAASDNP